MNEANILSIKASIYDEQEIHTNCTVEILRNSVTGETSIGWWENDNPPTGVSGNE